MDYVPFEKIAVQPRITSQQVQDFIDWFDCFDPNEISEEDGADLSRAYALRSAVMACGVTEQQFRVECVVIVRENGYTEYIRDEYNEVHEGSIAALPDLVRGNIDWQGVAADARGDFAEFDWEGDNYLFNASVVS